MPGENSISFKVYILENNDESVEVRRFEVDQGVVTNYDYIRERLQYVFPRLRGKVFKILWKDAENDEVTISSDEEMMIALSEIKSDLCKLLVRIPSEANDSADNPTFSIPLTPACPALDEGANACSACQKPIQGFRYKCLECVQYNQCTDCEYRGTHTDHVMIRMSREYPTLRSLIPRGIQVVKQHMGVYMCKPLRGTKFGRSCPFSFGESSRRDESKGKCGGHRRRSRKFSHGNGEKHCGSQPSQPTGCSTPGYIYGDLEGLVNSFLNLFPKTVAHFQQPMDTDDSSSQEDNATAPPKEDEASAKKDGATKKTDEENGSSCAAKEATPLTMDGPPQPVKISKQTEEESVDLTRDSEPGSSNKCPNPKIAEAVKMLTEMGFNDEGKWLSKILERFDGDIYKALDVLMQHKK